MRNARFRLSAQASAKVSLRRRRTVSICRASSGVGAFVLAISLSPHESLYEVMVDHK